MKEVEWKRKLQDDKKGVFEDQMKRISPKLFCRIN